MRQLSGESEGVRLGVVEGEREGDPEREAATDDDGDTDAPNDTEGVTLVARENERDELRLGEADSVGEAGLLRGTEGDAVTAAVTDGDAAHERLPVTLAPKETDGDRDAALEDDTERLAGALGDTERLPLREGDTDGVRETVGHASPARLNDWLYCTPARTKLAMVPF